jgi:hypothetical protein
MASNQPTMRLATTKVFAKGPIPVLGATLLKSALGASSVRQYLLDPVSDWLAELRMDKQIRTASRASEGSGHDNVTKYTDQDRPDLDEPAGNINCTTYAGRSDE